MGVDLQQVLAHRKVGAIKLSQKDKSIESEPVCFHWVVGGYNDAMLAAQQCHRQTAFESNEFGAAVAIASRHCLTSKDGSGNGFALRSGVAIPQLPLRATVRTIQLVSSAAADRPEATRSNAKQAVPKRRATNRPTQQSQIRDWKSIVLLPSHSTG